MSRFALLPGLLVAAAMLVACSTTSAPSRSDEQPPDGSKVVCHLDCSGKQAQGYGATEAEARDNVRAKVEATCNPEDGQFFIFCETLK